MAKPIVGALDEARTEVAGHTLARAFHDDPLQIHVFPDAAERAQRSPAQFSIFVREACLFGEVVAADGMAGVSLWMRPASEAPADPAAPSEMPRLQQIMGKEAVLRFGRVLDYLSQTHGKAMPPNLWYLMAVGVLPERQGRGEGQALLAPIIARADAARVPICLDTAQPRVRPFYERLGFRVAQETVDPASGLRFWTYRRDPA